MMRDTSKHGRAYALALDAAATCKMETVGQTAGKWAIVRDASGNEIGRHRTAAVAWESAFFTLKKRNQRRQ